MFWREQPVDHFFSCEKVPAVETSALPSVPPDDVSGIYEGLYDWGGTLLGCGPNSSYPDNIPVAPKMATFPLSSVVLGDTGSDGNNSYPDDDDNHPTSLATAKPKTIENDTQSEVSRFFLPRRGSCSMIMALTIDNKSGRLRLRGWVQSHRE